MATCTPVRPSQLAASMYSEYPRTSMTPEPVLRKCTPFCDKNKDCPEHHELLVAIVNCTDMLGSLSNLDSLKECVEKYIKKGWSKDDDVPDPVIENRLPLIHWAASLGKCNALEWMLASGFSAVAKSSGVGETALHRSTAWLYKSRPKFTVKELTPKFSKMVNLLKETLLVKDDSHGETPLHTAAGMLVNGDHKPNFFQTCIELVVQQAKRMGDHCSVVLNAVNDDGDTALHMLACGERHKIDFCCQAVRTLIMAGADRSIRNNGGKTSLDIALARGTEAIVEELIKVVDTDDNGLLSSLNSDDADGFSYGALADPSPPLSNLSKSVESPVMHVGISDDEDGYPHIAHVQSVKVEPLEDDQDVEQQIQQLKEDHASSTDLNGLDSLDGSGLLRHLCEAGLLHDVSSLVGKAQARDEGNLRKVQVQARVKVQMSQIKKHEAFQNALADVKKGVGLRKSAKYWGISPAGLWKRVNGKVNYDKAGRRQVISLAEEQRFTEWLIERSNRGLGATKNEFLDAVKLFLDKDQRQTRFVNNRPGNTWYRGFLKRNPQVNLRSGRSLDKKRAKISPNDLDGWFQQFSNFIEENPLGA